jgi:hypothetical protein
MPVCKENAIPFCFSRLPYRPVQQSARTSTTTLSLWHGVCTNLRDSQSAGRRMTGMQDNHISSVLSPIARGDLK